MIYKNRFFPLWGYPANTPYPLSGKTFANKTLAETLPKRAKKNGVFALNEVTMDQQSHKKNQNRANEFLDQEYLFLAELFLAELGDIPAPLTENHSAHKA